MSNTPKPKLQKEQIQSLYDAMAKTPMPPQKDFDHFYNKFSSEPDFQKFVHAYLGDFQDRHKQRIEPDFNKFLEDLKKKADSNPVSKSLQIGSEASKNTLSPALNDDGTPKSLDQILQQLPVPKGARVDVGYTIPRQAENVIQTNATLGDLYKNTEPGRIEAAQKIAAETVKTAEIYEREGLLSLAKSKAESQLGITADQIKALPVENQEMWRKLNPRLYDVIIKADQGTLSDDEIFFSAKKVGATPEELSFITREAASKAQQASADRIKRLKEVYPEAFPMAERAAQIAKSLQRTNFDIKQYQDDINRLKPEVDEAAKDLALLRGNAKALVDKAQAVYAEAAKKGKQEDYDRAKQAYEKAIDAYNSIQPTPEMAEKIKVYNDRIQEVNNGVNSMQPMLEEIEQFKANPGFIALSDVYDMNKREADAIAAFVESKKDTYYEKIVRENFGKVAAEFGINPYKVVTMQFLGSLAKGAVTILNQDPESAESIRDQINSMPLWSNSQVYAAAKPKNLMEEDMSGKKYIAWDRAPVFIYDQVLRMTPYLLTAATGAGAPAIIGVTALSVYDDMYQEFREAGLSNKEAQALGMVSALITGSIEKINPVEKVFVLKASKKALEKTVAQAAATGWIKARNNSVQFAINFGKNMIEQLPPEALEEVADGTKDKIIKQAVGLDFSPWTGEELGETLLGLSMVVATLGGAGAAYNQSRFRSHAIQSFVRNGEADKVRDILWQKSSLGEITPEQFNSVHAQLMKYEKMNNITSSWKPPRAEGEPASDLVKTPTDLELTPTPDELYENDDTTGKKPDPGSPVPPMAQEETIEGEEKPLTPEEAPDFDEKAGGTEEDQDQAPRILGQDRAGAITAKNEALKERAGYEEAIALAGQENDLETQLRLRQDIKAIDERIGEFDMAIADFEKGDREQVVKMMGEVADAMGYDIDEDVLDVLAETQLMPFVDDALAEGTVPDLEDMRTAAAEMIDLLDDTQKTKKARPVKPVGKPPKPGDEPPASSGGAVVEDKPKEKPTPKVQEFKEPVTNFVVEIDISGSKPEDITENGSKTPDKKALQYGKKLSEAIIAKTALEPFIKNPKAKSNVSTNFAPIGGDLTMEFKIPGTNKGLYVSMGFEREGQGMDEIGDYGNEKLVARDTFMYRTFDLETGRSDSNMWHSTKDGLDEFVKALGRIPGIKKAEAQPEPKTETKGMPAGTSVTFKPSTGEGQLTGEIIDLPGFEKFDTVLVQSGMLTEIYDLSTGTKLFGSDKTAFTKEDAISAALNELLDAGWSEEKYIKALKKDKPLNPSPAYDAIIAQEKAEAESMPFVVSDEKERAKLVALSEKAKELGLSGLAQDAEREATRKVPVKKDSFSLPPAPYSRFVERLRTEGLNKAIEQQKEANLPLTKGMRELEMVRAPGSFDEFLSKITGPGKSDYMTPEIVDAIRQSWEMETELVQAYGYSKKLVTGIESGIFTIASVFAATNRAKSDARKQQLETARTQLLEYPERLRGVYESRIAKAKAYDINQKTEFEQKVEAAVAELSPAAPAPKPKPRPVGPEIDKERFPVAGQHENHPEFIKIKERYQNANKAYGREFNFYKPNGEKLRLRAVLVGAYDVATTHNERTFAKTPGVPLNKEGRTLNDRDYQTSVEAQGIVNLYGADFTGLALQAVPVVTKDGIVVSGNNRTMSRRIASEGNTDAKYMEDLDDALEANAIPPIAREGMEAPMLAYELVVTPEYTTAEFLSWNDDDKKAKSPLETALAMSKALTEEQKNIMVRILDAPGISDPLQSKYAADQIKKFMIDTGLIQAGQVASYFDKDTNLLNTAGQDLIENIILTSLLNEDQVKMMNEPGSKRLKSTLAKIKFELLANTTTAPGFRIMPDIMAAVELSRILDSQKDKDKPSFAQYMKQTSAFGKFEPTRNQAIMYFALQSYQGAAANLKAFVKEVNQAGNPLMQGGMFEEVVTPAERVDIAFDKLLHAMNNPEKPYKEDGEPIGAADNAELERMKAGIPQAEPAQQQEEAGPAEAATESIAQPQPTQPQPSERKAKRQRKIEDTDGEIAAKVKELNDRLKNKLGAGVDPEALKIATELTIAYVKKGLLKLADIIEDIYIEYGPDNARKLGQYVKIAYNTARIRMRSTHELQSNNEVAQFNIEAYVQQLEREDADTGAGEADGSNAEDGAGIPGQNPEGGQPKPVPPPTTGAVQPGQGGSNGGRTISSGSGNTGTRTDYSGTGNPGINEQQGGRSNGQPQDPSEGAIRPRGKDYVSPPDFTHPASFSKALRFDANIKALETLLALKEEERMATPAEQDILSQYAGWGGLKMIAANLNSRLSQEESQFADRIARAQELILKIDPSGEYLEQAKKTVFSSFYTAKPVIRAMHNALKHMGFKGGSILEPSAGIGDMKAAAPNQLLENGKWTLVEMDGITSEISKHLHPSATNVHSKFEESKVPENYYDVVIANFPFGPYSVSDYGFTKKGVAQERAASKIHNYFALKTLDNLRPGGISMFITTHGTLDSGSNGVVRQYIQDKAKILGVVRLPNTAFLSNANTEVVTDIIVLQKPLVGELVDNKIDITAMEDAYLQSEDGRINFDTKIPKYLADNPQYVLGTMGATMGQFGPEITVQGTSVDALESMIYEALKAQVPAGIYAESKVVDQQQGIEAIDAIPGLRNGNLHIKNGKPYVYRIGEDNVARLVPYDGQTPHRIPYLIAVRNAMNALFEAEYKGLEDEVVEPLREKLNKEYAKFVNSDPKSGPLRLRGSGNQSMMQREADRYNLMGLEKWSSDGKAYLGKADIMERRVLNAKPSRDPGSMTVREAVLVSFTDFARLDMDYVGKLAGKTAQEAAEEIGIGTQIFELPQGGYEMKDQYLTGNIYDKLEAAEAAALIDPVRYEANIKALRDVLPPVKALEDTIPRFGAPFITTLQYSKFLQDLFRSNRVVIHKATGSTSLMQVDSAASSDGSEGDVNFSVRDSRDKKRMSAFEIVNRMFEGRPLRINDRIELPDGKIISVLNEQLTARANQIALEIQRAFEDFLYSNAEARQTYEANYNVSENAQVRPNYDGSWLDFPGMSQIMTPRKHQLDAVAMILQRNGGYIDHMVGAGKTMVMIMAAMKLKQTGVANKVGLVVLKSTIGQIADSFQALYPGAKILAPRSVDFKSENRNAMLGQIANNNWDVVILTHEQFGLIPVSPERERETIEEAVMELTATMEQMEETKSGSSTKAYMELEKRRNNLYAKLQESMAKQREKQDLDQRYFEQLGIDHIMVDEAHMFKNLAYSTSKGQMAGLGSPSGNSKTTTLLSKIRFIQEKLQGDKGVTFLSGTPVTNSIAELYNIFKYLIPNELDRRDIKTFDDFTNRYAIAEPKAEFDVTGRPVSKMRLREFIELQALSQLYRIVADVRNDDNLTLPKPVMQDGKMTMVQSEPSPLEKEFAVRLMNFAAEKADSNDVFDVLELPTPPTGPAAYKAKMLLATTYASKAAIDLRLIYPNAPYNPKGKIGQVVAKVKELYNLTDADKGAQLIFSDIGVPKSENPIDNFYDALDLLGEIDEDTLKATFAESMDPNTDEITKYKKIDKIMSALEKLGYEKEDLDAIYAEANVKPVESANFKNVYVEVKKRLIELGIPEQEIQFIHDWKSDAKKAELMAKVISGEVRVVLGGTKNLGTGVNVQDKLYAVHHLDVPWTPAALDQRNGRLIRQGANLVKQYTATPENPYGVAQVYAYVTPETLDGMKYELLATKHSFATKFRTGSFVGNSMKDSEDDSDVLAQMAAAIMGDTRILELSNLQKELQQIQNEYKGWQNRFRDAQSKKESRQNSINKRIELDAVFDKDIDLYNQNVKKDEEGKPVFEVTIKGTTYTQETREQLGTVMTNLNAELKADFNFRTNTERKIGTVYGFDYFAEKVGVDVGGQVSRIEYFVRSPLTGQKYTKATPTLSESKGLAARDAIDRLETINKAKELNQKALTEDQSMMESYDRVLDSKFGRKEEMEAIEQRVAEMTLAMGGSDMRDSIPAPSNEDFRQYWSPEQRQRAGMEAVWREVKEAWDDLDGNLNELSMNPIKLFGTKEARFVKALYRLAIAEIKLGMKAVKEFIEKHGLQSISKIADMAWNKAVEAVQKAKGQKPKIEVPVLKPAASVAFAEELDLIVKASSGDVIGLFFNLSKAKSFYAGIGDEQSSIALAMIEEIEAGMPKTDYGDAVKYIESYAGKALLATARKYTLSPPSELTRPSIRAVVADKILAIHTAFSRFEPLRNLERKLNGGKSPASGVSLATSFETGLGVNARAEADLMQFYNDVIVPVEDIAARFEDYLFWMRVKDRNAADVETRKTGNYSTREADLALATLEQEIGPEDWKRLVDAGQEFQNAFDAMLLRAVDADVLGQAGYNAIKEMNDFYAGFQVITEYVSDENSDPNNQPILGDVIKRIKGIKDPDFKIRHILEVAAETIYKARKQHDANMRRLNMAETLLKLDKDKRYVRKVRLVAPVTDPLTGATSIRFINPRPKPGFGLVYYRKEGKIRAIEVPTNVAQAFAWNSLGTAKPFLAILNVFQKPLKLGATAFNISFLPVNLAFYDSPRLALLSKYGIKRTKAGFMSPFDTARFMLDMTYSFAAVIVGKNLGDRVQLYEKAVKTKVIGKYLEQMVTDYKEFQQTEASGYTFTSLNNPEAFRKKLRIKYENETKGQKAAQSVGAGYDFFLNSFVNPFEQTTKFAAVQRAKRIEGIDNLHDLESRDKNAYDRIMAEIINYGGSPNFLKAGTSSKWFNAIFPYFMARLNSITADLQRLAGKDMTESDHSTMEAWSRLAQAVVLPTALLTMYHIAMGIDFEDEESMFYVPDNIRQNNFILFSNRTYVDSKGRTRFLYYTIPTAGAMKWLKNGTEAAINAVYNAAPSYVGRYIKETAMDFIPLNLNGKNMKEVGESLISSSNPIFKTNAEIIFERNTFFHSDLIPYEFQSGRNRNLPEYMKYNEQVPLIFVRTAEALGTKKIVDVSPHVLEQAAKSVTADLFYQLIPLFGGQPADGEVPMATKMPFLRRLYRVTSPSETKDYERLNQFLEGVAVEDMELKHRAALAMELRDKMSEQERAQYDIKLQKEDPELMKALVKVIRAESRPDLKFIEKMYLQVNVDNRAQAIWEAELSKKSLSKEEKKARVQELINKRVTPPPVSERLYRYIDGKYDEIEGESE